MSKLLPRLAIGLCLFAPLPSMAASEVVQPHEPPGGWPHDGIFGTFDRAAAQRGFQVYKEVCAACHGLKHVAYRNLTDLGLSEEDVKTIAGEYQVTDGPNDAGEMFQRPARPADRFVKPYTNDLAARAANNGALPPDLSLIIEARHDGANYVYSLLTGYASETKTKKLCPTLMDGMNCNPYFPGMQIGMPAPLNEGQVTYADGTPATVEQMAKDVTTFLSWAAEPNMELRKQTGIKVILFLLVMAGLLYGVKRRIWRKLH